jgi:hypothetical protein
MAWDVPRQGFRDRLKEEVRMVERSHLSIINDSLIPGSKAHGIAVMSVKNSVAWILQFIMYIDDTCRDLIGENTFSKEKAWQLVTQLGTRIFKEISKP